ncbi:ABC transporter permease [Liquorilactobacillus satsumensis]|uniref:ABC transporter permease n=1 Tax=Liquorilactobacillus satsumensis TaxID=259059 RepID=UPI0039ED5520
MKKSDDLQKKWTPYLYVLPAFFLILLLIVYPVVTSLSLSLKDKVTSHFTLDNYHYFFTDQVQLGNIGYTLFVAVMTVILALLLGFVLALYIRFNNNSLSKTVVALTVLPQFIPGLVAVYSIMLVVRNGGVLSRIAQSLGFTFNPNLMYSANGLIMVNLWFNIPFAALLLLASLANVRQASIESARDIGADKWTVLFKIILPATYKQFFIAGAFFFMTNVGSFTTPFLMGGNNPQMLGVVLYKEFNQYLDYNKAAALSVILFLLCSLSAIVYVIVNLRQEKWR